MDDLSSLPLFSWRQVVAFPVDRETSKVRETAEELLARSGENAEAFMRMTAAGIQRRFASVGFDQVEIDRQVAAFMLAVQAEMVRIVYQPASASPDGGGAA